MQQIRAAKCNWLSLAEVASNKKERKKNTNGMPWVLSKAPISLV